MGTQFTEVYNRFLGKITDDMYVELTPKTLLKLSDKYLILFKPYF